MDTLAGSIDDLVLGGTDGPGGPPIGRLLHAW
jgi:hypothetical protein